MSVFYRPGKHGNWLALDLLEENRQLLRSLFPEHGDQGVKVTGEELSNQGIAKKLFISERTARTYVSNILQKLHLPNRTQAALFALREGLTSPEVTKEVEE